MKFENSPFNIPKTFQGKENNQLNLETVRVESKRYESCRKEL